MLFSRGAALLTIAVRRMCRGMIAPSLVHTSGNKPMKPNKPTPVSLRTSIVGTRPVAGHACVYLLLTDETSQKVAHRKHSRQTIDMLSTGLKIWTMQLQQIVHSMV